MYKFKLLFSFRRCLAFSLIIYAGPPEKVTLFKAILYGRPNYRPPSIFPRRALEKMIRGASKCGPLITGPLPCATGTSRR